MGADGQKQGKHNPCTEHKHNGKVNGICYSQECKKAVCSYCSKKFDNKVYCMECYAWNVQNEKRKKDAKAGSKTQSFSVVKGGFNKQSSIQVSKSDGQLMGWESLFNQLDDADSKKQA